jgi:hypothetical protein
MSRKILIAALAAALFPGLALAEEVTVYRTKNADGTYSYTQVPTTGAETRTLGHREPENPAPARQLTPEQQYCEQARKNLQALSTDQPLGSDTDGDGVADVLISAEDRAAQRSLAQSQVEAYCRPAGTAAPATPARPQSGSNES